MERGSAVEAATGLDTSFTGGEECTAPRSAERHGSEALLAGPGLHGDHHGAGLERLNDGRITHDPGEHISWTNRPPVSLPMDTDADHRIVTTADP
ncbi:MAG: hypothetical protein OXH70_15750 [Acidobacteria bacterium]|nr:hypothetical protein [Acidobacteriota bacterium]